MAIKSDKKRLMITLREEFFNILEELAQKEDITKSKIIEKYLQRVAKRRQNVGSTPNNNRTDTPTLGTSS